LAGLDELSDLLWRGSTKPAKKIGRKMWNCILLRRLAYAENEVVSTNAHLRWFGHRATRRACVWKVAQYIFVIEINA
jgi:hypothetical protein